MAVAVRDLEAAAHQHDGAVALPLCAGLGPGERKPQRGAVGCGPHDAGPFKEAGDRCDTDLGVNLAVVLVLDPRERGLVQEREREIGTCSSMAKSRPSTEVQKASCFPFW